MPTGAIRGAGLIEPSLERATRLGGAPNAWLRYSSIASDLKEMLIEFGTYNICGHSHRFEFDPIKQKPLNRDRKKMKKLALILAYGATLSLMSAQPAFAKSQPIERWSPSATGYSKQQAEMAAKNNARAQADDICRKRGGYIDIHFLDIRRSESYDGKNFSASVKYRTWCFQ